MDSSDEKGWVKSATNELNNLLQVISESALVLGKYAEGSPETKRFADLIRDALARAINVTRTMGEQAGGYGTELPIGEGITVPAVWAPHPEAEADRNGGTIEISNPEGKRELVMIVDDEEVVTLLAEQVLAAEGYRIITALDGFTAIEIYRKLRDEISLIILDFTMPVIDGADVFDELLQINPKVPVVLSSGFAERDLLSEMLSKGLRGFIPKPYTPQKLLTQIRATLNVLQAEGGSARSTLLR